MKTKAERQRMTVIIGVVVSVLAASAVIIWQQPAKPGGGGRKDERGGNGQGGTYLMVRTEEDDYDMIGFTPGGVELVYRDTVDRRSGEVVQRTIVAYRREGGGEMQWQAFGRLRSGKRHGTWNLTHFRPTFATENTWCWDGEEITEAEWYRRGGDPSPPPLSP